MMGWPSAPELARDNSGLIAVGVFTSYGAWTVANVSLTLLLVWWTFICYGNVGPLGGRRRFGASTSVWAWFIPIANLWWPFQVIEDIRVTFDSTPRALLVAWWTTWIVGWSLVLVVGPEDLLANGVTTLAMLLGAMTVLSLTREQHEAVEGAIEGGAPSLAR